jgi:hypothetical protein
LQVSVGKQGYWLKYVCKFPLLLAVWLMVLKTINIFFILPESDGGVGWGGVGVGVSLRASRVYN